MRSVLYFLTIIIFAFAMGNANAQVITSAPNEPAMPTPLANAVSEGAQSYYLGEFKDLYGWAIIRQGKPEFFYANKDGSALMMGLLFDGNGDMVTNGQLAQLQYREGDDMFAITNDMPQSSATVTPTETAEPQLTQVTPPVDDRALLEPLTPAQEMYVDVRSANWLTWGENGMYEIFVFIDPDCPHCKAFLRDMEDPFVKEGYLKIRVIPIGFNEASARRAAFLLASANPQERLVEYAKGSTDVLNPPANINTTAVDKNRSLMRKWGLDATPTIIYRAGNGEIRFIRGKPDDYSAMIQDLLATN